VPLQKYVYKINLLSDAIKYLSSDSPRHAGARVRHSPSRHPRPPFGTLFLRALAASRFSFSAEQPIPRGFVSRPLRELRNDAWPAIGRMQIENRYCSSQSESARCTSDDARRFRGLNGTFVERRNKPVRASLRPEASLAKRRSSATERRAFPRD